MREALADSPQFAASRRERAAGPKQNGKRANSTGAIKWLRFLNMKRRPGKKIFLGLAALAALGVPLNALYFQEGRHPAPLFYFGARDAGLPKSAMASAPLPPPRPAEITQAGAASAKTEAPRPDVARGGGLADAISRLLEVGAPKPAPGATSARKAAAAKSGAPKAAGGALAGGGARAKPPAATGRFAKSAAAPARAAAKTPAAEKSGAAARPPRPLAANAQAAGR